MIESTGNDLVVVATNPQEMVAAQKSIIASVAMKIEGAKSDLVEAQEILRAADMAQIDNSAAKRLIKKEEHRLLYLEKTHAALSAGYVIVPNLPGDIIAIRVKRKNPEQPAQYNVKGWPTPETETSEALAVGEGRYVKPIPDVTVENNTDSQGNIINRSLWINSFDENLALPAEFLKPTIIERTGEAFKMKIFDELLVVHNGSTGDSSGSVSVRQGDPLVIGRIFDGGNGRKRFYRKRVLSFLVAWFVDTSAI